MKKIIITIVVTLFIAALLYNIFTSGDITIFSSEVDLTLIDTDYTENITVETGSTFQIDPLSKSGFLLLWYFDSAEGGEKYIDSQGKSVSKWKKGFPTTLYTQWKKIEDISWTSKTFYSEEATHVGSTNNGGPKIECKLSEEFVEAINSNPTKNINITVTLKAKYVGDHDKPMTVRVQDTNQSGYEILDKKTSSLSSSYQGYSVNLTVKASDIDNGKFYINIDNQSHAYWVTMYIKDVTIKANFI